MEDGTGPVDATAEVVAGPELEEITRRIKEKDGLFTEVTKLLGTIGGTVSVRRMLLAGELRQP
ncbi:MAG: hypothetical protein OEV40_24005 [Acidimicrobiia bacterium]|nr:hypothetical protein [Acidimicrobiia bacterium]